MYSAAYPTWSEFFGVRGQSVRSLTCPESRANNTPNLWSVDRMCQMSESAAIRFTVADPAHSGYFWNVGRCYSVTSLDENLTPSWIAGTQIPGRLVIWITQSSPQSSHPLSSSADCPITVPSSQAGSSVLAGATSAESLSGIVSAVRGTLTVRASRCPKSLEYRPLRNHGRATCDYLGTTCEDRPAAGDKIPGPAGLSDNQPWFKARRYGYLVTKIAARALIEPQSGWNIK
ncbi:hypothetical protein FB45DRAFT_874063 [Roridomyces roridus]|uniref:Uncharacterized protein n=1 Tax=Roridomyces roridus TaxID=1738132 RepID=A0AAD7BAB3_9AGAR|nr:hypothetical protein FB45DRAFT_874063 [Roridomyces roridus]